MANPTLLTSPIAENGDKNVIPASTGATTGLLDQEHGFQQINELPLQAGGLPPQRKDFNGVFNLLSKILFYTQKGWQFEFDENQDYYAECIVKDTDGNMYECIADVSASSTHPKDDKTNWQKHDLSQYLPLDGGTMVGGSIINLDTDDDLIRIIGGNSTSPRDAGSITLWGKNATGTSSAVALVAGNGTNASQLNLLHTGKINFYPDIINLPLTVYDLGGASIVGNSLTQNGYTKRADGLIVQWGSTTITANTPTPITLPISFTGSDQTKRHTFVCPHGSDSTSTASVVCYNVDNSHFGLKCSISASVDWLAIGF